MQTNLKTIINEVLKFHISPLTITFSEKNAEFFLENSEIHCEVINTEEKSYLRFKFWPKYSASIADLLDIVKTILSSNYNQENIVYTLPVISNADELYVIYDKELKVSTETRHIYDEIVWIDSKISEWVQS